jgi:parallel beta-helix repeat protein
VIELKRAITALFVILCLLSMERLTGHEISVKAETNVVYVDLNNISGPWNGSSTYPYENVTSALENALDGYTILVRKGTYSEHLVVNKSVSLVGEDVDSTIIDGYRNDTIISVTASNVNIKCFTLRNSGTDVDDSAICLGSCSGNVICNNKIVNNNIGITFNFSVNNVISGNIVSNNYYGIIFDSSNNNVVSGDTIINNLYGIRFYSSINNTVLGNTVYYNKPGFGISLFYSMSNTFYHNNFNNTQQVLCDLRSINTWDYCGEGNYWSSYQGHDLDNDGIGDDPHTIDVNNQDNYPLMGTFSDFSITLQQETYDVALICNSTISGFRFQIGAETGNKMIYFNVTGEDGTVGFCRVAVPVQLMNYSLVIMVDGEEITPTFLNVSSEMYRYLYFAYTHMSHAITIVSSETLYLYNELLSEYAGLQTSLNDINATYYGLLYNFSTLLENYTLLQESYRELNSSYQEHLLAYSEDTQNMRNLTYAFATATAIFLIITIYLSKHAHTRIRAKQRVAEEE